MEKLISIIMTITVLASLAACGNTATHSASQTQSTGEESLKNTDQPLFDEGEIKARLEEAAAACVDVVYNLGYDGPTLEQHAQMLRAIGALGLPVYHWEFDMVNYETVRAFFENVKAGKDAQVTIYCLNNFSICADVLVAREGCFFMKPFYYDFGTRKCVLNEPVYTVENIQMTEKGYLLYDFPNQEAFTKWSTGYRVLPLGEENHELRRKYILNLGYDGSCILRYDWDKDDFSQLDLGLVFETFYTMVHGKYPENVYGKVDKERNLSIPADVMEEIMLGKMPVTARQLRDAIPYDQAKNTYTYQPFWGGGYTPRPEIVKVVRGEDGTLSLTIDAVAVEFGTDQSMSSVLTIRENPDGSIQYISNVIIISYEPFLPQE